jgi:hypothetical protein
MKFKSSSYVLAAEILIVILFHAVKIRQGDKHPGEMAFTQVNKPAAAPKLNTHTRPSTEYLLVDLVK